MEAKMQKVIYLILAGVVISALLLGLRSTALKSAYDAASGTTINDSQGVVHTVAASGVSGDTAATLYTLATGLVWLLIIIGIVLTLMGKW